MDRWYLITTLDRWIHYDHRRVIFGYIIVGPFFEPLRIASTIYLIWGTWKVVWRELEYRFTHPGYWWFGAQFALFIVILVSLYYLVLYLALAIIWMQFLSLNTIADVASKRTAFDVATTTFFFVFGILTLVASTDTTFFKAKQHGGAIASVSSPTVLLVSAWSNP